VTATRCYAGIRLSSSSLSNVPQTGPVSVTTNETSSAWQGSSSLWVHAVAAHARATGSGFWWGTTGRLQESPAHAAERGT
jgi:hypothetical protein